MKVKVVTASLDFRLSWYFGTVYRFFSLKHLTQSQGQQLRLMDLALFKALLLTMKGQGYCQPRI